jgi:hypothetical protein
MLKQARQRALGGHLVCVIHNITHARQLLAGAADSQVVLAQRRVGCQHGLEGEQLPVAVDGVVLVREGRHGACQVLGCCTLNIRVAGGG